MTILASRAIPARKAICYMEGAKNMNRMISYDKMSKKEKKAYDEKRRLVWAISPVTRKKESGKAYSRKKARKWDEDVSFTALFVCPVFTSIPRRCFAKNAVDFKPQV